MSFFKKHKKGIIGTIIYHVIILLILIFLGFFTPLPLPGEEGILVNFGNTDNGSGMREPSPVRNNPTPQQPVQQEEKEEVPPPPPTSPPEASQPEVAEEVAMTQDYEETAAIKAAEEKKKEEERIRQERLAEERRRQEQLEKEREAERIRKAEEEAERLRKEEEARKAEEQERRINEINNRVQGAFSNNNATGTGNEGNDEGRSQGTTFPGGNQGVATGDPNSGSFGQGGSGSGNQGSGPSYSLSGRSARNLPRPDYPGDDEGIVVVKITVDKYGKVTAAEPGARGTTIMNERFWNEAKQAALKANFNSDESAPAFQQGTITYRFVLD